VGLFTRHAARASGGVAIVATDSGIDFRHGKPPLLNMGSYTTSMRELEGGEPCLSAGQPVAELP
jgi:hypothetical protein